mgnify:CR=1 FL=1
MRKAINIILLILIIIVIVVGAGLIIFNKAGKAAEKDIGDFTPVTKELEDGCYKGDYSIFLGLAKTEVELEIRDSTLIKCELLKLVTTPGYGIAEKILSNINTSGNLDFEAVSGATYSCSFVRAAIKEAVEKGKQ